jgi:hypothetical protein
MLSGMWLAYSIWQYLTECGVYDNGVVWCRVYLPLLIAHNSGTPTDLSHITAGIFGPPIGGMILGLIAFWVAKGFAAPSKSN